MENTYYRRSITTHKQYNIFDKDILKIINPLQAAFYVSRGCDLLAVKPSTDRKTGEPIFVYWFFRSDSKQAYDEWCNRKREQNDLPR